MRYAIGYSDSNFNYEVIDTEKGKTIINLNLYKNTKLVCDILNADLLCHPYFCEESQRIKELEDAIKCSNLLIEQLENQNDKLIKQRDNAEQELALYKKAKE